MPDTMVITDFLSTVEFFRSLPPDALTRLAAKMEKREFAAGDKLINTEDRGQFMYVVCSGSVRLKFDERPVEESPALIVHKGDVFGLVSMLSDNAKSDLAVARETTVVCRMAKPSLLEVLSLYPQLCTALTRQMSRIFSFEPTLIFTTKAHSQFESIQEIARNKGQAVYKAKLFKQNQFLTIKMVPFDLALDPGFAERAEADLQAILRLRHKHIAAAQAFVKAYGTYFVHSETASGETLQSTLLRRRLTIKESLHILQQIAETLAYAHGKGILHRDLSAEKIVLSNSNFIKILDFAIGHREIAEGPDGSVVLLDGSPGSLSPEQVRGEQASPQGDLFSLGVIAYHMLTGKPPFTGKTPCETAFARIKTAPADPCKLNVSIPPELGQLVMTLLDPDPRKREISPTAFSKPSFSVPDGGSSFPLAGPSMAPYNLSGHRLGDKGLRRRSLRTGLTLALLAGIFLVWSRQHAPRPGPATSLLEKQDAEIQKHSSEAVDAAAQMEEKINQVQKTLVLPPAPAPAPAKTDAPAPAATAPAKADAPKAAPVPAAVSPAPAPAAPAAAVVPASAAVAVPAPSPTTPAVPAPSAVSAPVADDSAPDVGPAPGTPPLSSALGGAIQPATPEALLPQLSTPAPQAPAAPASPAASDKRPAAAGKTPAAAKPAIAPQAVAEPPPAPPSQLGMMINEQANENMLLKGQILAMQKQYRKAIALWKKISPQSKFYAEAQENITQAQAAQKHRR